MEEEKKDGKNFIEKKQQQKKRAIKLKYTRTYTPHLRKNPYHPFIEAVF